MKDSEFNIFAEAIVDAYEFNPGGKAPGPKAISAGFRILKNYPLESVLRAIQYHQATVKFGPSVAELVDILEANRPKHPEPNEAWAIVVKSFDEAQTVFLTQPMRDARLIATELWVRGDAIAARMAFIDAYKKITQVKAGPIPEWEISPGYDPELREAGIAEALQLGRITQERAQKLLPSIRDGGEVGRLLIGGPEPTESPAEKAASWDRQKLSEFKVAMQKKFDEIAEKDRKEILERYDRQQKLLEEHRARVHAALEQVDGSHLTDEVKAGLKSMHQKHLEAENGNR